VRGANSSDDLFDELRDGLGKRTRDRESSVRVQAVIALARFQSSDDEAGVRVTKALIELLQHDPSAYLPKIHSSNESEVRRAVLFNLEQTRATILFIIERARDVDAINRRCVYSRSMNEIGDFRILSIGNRERILRWGLRDRDPNNKKAAVRMFAHKWVEQASNNVLEVLPLNSVSYKVTRTT
jgi:condensin complex subunit 3